MRASQSVCLTRKTPQLRQRQLPQNLATYSSSVLDNALVRDDIEQGVTSEKATKKRTKKKPAQQTVAEKPREETPKNLTTNVALKNLVIPGTTIVRTPTQALHAISILKLHRDRVHAWDTETIGIDAKEESPVGKG